MAYLTQDQILALENNGFLNFDLSPSQYLYILSNTYKSLSSVADSEDIIDFTHIRNIRKAPKLDAPLTQRAKNDWQLTAEFTNNTATGIPVDSNATPTNKMVIAPGQTISNGTVLYNISTLNTALTSSAVEITQQLGHTFGQTGVYDSFSIHGLNTFNVSVWDQATYSLDNAVSVREEMSMTSLRNGRTDPSEFVQDAMIAQSQLYSYQLFKTIVNGTHQVKDGATSVYSAVKNYGYTCDLADSIAGYNTKQEYFNNVYDAVVTEINKSHRRGINLGSSLIIGSLELITALQLSYKRMGTGDLSKQEIEDGFAGKVNGVLILPDYTLGAGADYSTGNITFIPDGKTTAVPLSLVIIDVRPTLLKIKHLPIEKLQLRPGDSKEIDVVRAKGADKWMLCVYEPKCISLYSLPAYVDPTTVKVLKEDETKKAK